MQIEVTMKWAAEYELHWREYVESVIKERFGACSNLSTTPQDVDQLHRALQSHHESDVSYEYQTPHSQTIEVSPPGPKKKKRRPSSLFPDFESKELALHSTDKVAMSLCERMAPLSPIAAQSTHAISLHFSTQESCTNDEDLSTTLVRDAGRKDSITFDFGANEEHDISTLLSDLEMVQESKKTKTRLPQPSYCSEISSILDKSSSLSLSAAASPILHRVQTKRGLELKAINGAKKEDNQEAVEWMLKREAPEVDQEIRGGVFVDEMDMRRMTTCIKLLNIPKSKAKKRPSLVICTLSMLQHWERQIKHNSQLSVGIYHGAQRNRFRQTPDFYAFDVIVSTYEALQAKEIAIKTNNPTQSTDDSSWMTTKRLQEKIMSRLHKVYWERVILDQAQSIASDKTQSSYQLQARAHWCTTSSQIANLDLHSLFKFIGILRIANDRHLSSLIDLYVFQRLKTLPAVENIDVTEKLSFTLDAERQWYNHVYHLSRRQVQEAMQQAEKPSGDQLAKLLMRLRQVCNSPSLLSRPLVQEYQWQDIPQVPLSTKMQSLFDALKAASVAHEPCLIISEWRRCLDLIKSQLRLQHPEISTTQIDGRSSTLERATLVEAYQSGDTNVLLLALNCGALGLNLTSTKRVFLMEPSWDLSLEKQILDRVLRGPHAVHITRYIIKDTIEEKIKLLHKNQRPMSEMILQDCDPERRTLRRRDIVDMVLK